ncbi:MAG: sterol desaturase family protein [Candidatus Rokubacteria bacterium]|nr:sterol desaturase family protein [Candidatus Rokubacteria bacterium]
MLLALWAGVEAAFPLRRRVQTRARRWRINAAIAATASMVIRGVQIPVALAVAAAVSAAGVGLIGWIGIPGLAAGVLGFVLLDYTTYVWHRLNHRVPFLWRFHRVHHTDLDLDVTTAFRFHFGELALSVAYRAAQVAIIDAAPVALLTYEIVMNAATEFHHSNTKLPLRWERLLNLALVTPRMHGIHHSIVERETNANWSVIFSWWDRLHRTLRLDVPQDAIAIGLPAFRRPQELTFRRLMLMPFGGQRPTWQLPDGETPDRSLHTDPRRLVA